MSYQSSHYNPSINQRWTSQNDVQLISHEIHDLYSSNDEFDETDKEKYAHHWNIFNKNDHIGIC